VLLYFAILSTTIRRQKKIKHTHTRICTIHTEIITIVHPTNEKLKGQRSKKVRKINEYRAKAKKKVYTFENPARK